MPLTTGADGRQLSYAAAGTGPRVILLHAMLGNGRAWAPVVESLADCECLCPDLPGHGKTVHHDGANLQAEAMADIETLAGGTPVHLVGHSFGATAALHYAVRRPSAVLSLTLIEPVYFILAKDAGDPAFDAYLAQMAPYAAAVEAGDAEAAASAFLQVWGGGSGLADLPERARARAVARIHLVAATQATLAGDETPGRLRLAQVSALRMPVTLVRSDGAPRIIPAIHRAIRAQVPQATEVVVPDADHMVALIHPEAVVDAVRSSVGRPGDASANGRSSP